MRWEELSVPQIAKLDREMLVVVLPLGSVEQHGRHLAVGTDTILAHALSLEAAKRSSGRVVVLPPPWFGFSPHHMRFPGTVTLRAETMTALVEDVAASVVAHGFRRLILINGHGGNNGIIDVLASKLGHAHYGRARIAALTYFQLARDAIAEVRKSRTGGMGHAGEFETAMMQHLRPELVDIERAETTYPDPGSSYLTTDLLGASAVRTYHDFGDLSPSGTLGDPSLATPENGARFFEAIVTSLALFIEDFAKWKIPASR